MLAWFGESLRFVTRVMIRESSPRQLAAGIALGVMIGLLPKANLIAVTLMFALCGLRINLLAGLVTAVFVSWLSPLFAPMLIFLGRFVLTFGLLQPLFGHIYQLPYVPWTEFNNTRVMGALLVGVLQFYPTYRLAARYFARRLGPYQEWRVRSKSSTVKSDQIPNAWRLG